MQLNNFIPNYKFHFIEKERTLITSDQTDMLADRLLWKIKKEIWKNASNYGKKNKVFAEKYTRISAEITEIVRRKAKSR